MSFLILFLLISVDSTRFIRPERCTECIRRLESSRTLVRSHRRYTRIASNICRMELMLIEESSTDPIYIHYKDDDLIGWPVDLVENPTKRYVSLLSHSGDKFYIHEKIGLLRVETMPLKYKWRHMTFTNKLGFVIVVKTENTLYLFTCQFLDLELVSHSLYSICEHLKTKYDDGGAGVPTGVSINEIKLIISYERGTHVWDYERNTWNWYLFSIHIINKGFHYEGEHFEMNQCIPHHIREYEIKNLEDFPFVKPSIHIRGISKEFQLCDFVGNCPRPCYNGSALSTGNFIEAVAMFVISTAFITTFFVVFGYCFFCIGIFPPFLFYLRKKWKSERAWRKAKKNSVNVSTNGSTRKLTKKQSPDVTLSITTQRQCHEGSGGSSIIGEAGSGNVHVLGKERNDKVLGDEEENKEAQKEEKTQVMPEVNVGNNKVLGDEEENKEAQKEEKTQMMPEVNVVDEMEVKKSVKKVGEKSKSSLEETQGETTKVHDLTTTSVDKL